MKKHYAEPSPVVKYGFIAAADRNYGTREIPQATASRCAQYGRTVIAILFWSREKPPARCAIPAIRPASFSS